MEDDLIKRLKGVRKIEKLYSSLQREMGTEIPSFFFINLYRNCLSKVNKRCISTKTRTYIAKKLKCWRKREG